MSVGLHMIPPSFSSNIQLLIDADYLSYQIGGLSQYKDRPKDKDDCEMVCLDEEADVWVWVEPEGLVDYKVRNAIEKLCLRFNTRNIRVYLSGKGNFRETVAVTKPYKGNRTGLRPYFYERVRQVLIDEYDAEVIDGREADDEVSIQQMTTDYDTVVVTNDKDLRNTPGYLYRPDSKELFRVHPSYCEWHFLKQMVTGDTVDNIPGIPGKGIRFFEKLVESRGHIEDLRNAVYQTYYTKDPSGTLLQEQGLLLHMMRDYDDWWEPDLRYGEDCPPITDILEDAVHLRGPYDSSV